MKTGNLLSKLAITTIATGMVALSQGCGSGGTSAANYLSGITLTSYSQNGDLWASLSAQLNTGNMMLIGATIPIVDPKHPGREYGSVSVASNLCTTAICTGGGTLTVSVDVTAITKFTTVSNLLPNGTPLPLGAAADAATIGIPIGKNGAVLYVALSNGVAVLGVALPFSALNTVGTYVPGADLFDVFTIGKITGDVGIFAGSAPGTTGIALFADLSSVVNTGTTANSSPVTANSLGSKAQIRVATTTTSPHFTAVSPSAEDKNELLYRLYEANSHHTHLKLQ